MEHKTYNIGKILDTTNLKILNCLQTSTKRQIPNHYVPGCHRVIKHGSFSQNVSIKPKNKQNNSTTIAMISGGEEIEIIERREDTDALWHMDLNPFLPEPLVTIYVNNQPFIVLADSGSEVNCISSRQVELFGLTDKIKETQSECCGPNGVSIETSGEIILEFLLGNQKYNAKFIVLHLARTTAGIIGYQFMKNNNISIHCGKSITNDPNYIHDVEDVNVNSPEYLKVRPIQNYEIDQYSIRSINLQISEYPRRMLKDLLLTPFYIFKRDEQPQVATMNQSCQFEYQIENKTSLLYTEEKADLLWGYAIPVANFNQLLESNGKKIGKIYPKDLLEYNSFNNTLFECTTAGFGLDCIDQSDLIPHSGDIKQNTIKDKGISVEEFLESNPCNNCKARGLQYYCSMTDDCTSEISKIRTVKSTPRKLDFPDQNNEHSSKCFYTSVTEPNCLLIDCAESVLIDGNSHEWGNIPPLRYKDFYYEEIQSHGTSVKILLPKHGRGFMSHKTKTSLRNTLEKYSFNKIFLNCTCRITYDNIQGLVNKSNTQYTVYNKTQKCLNNNCTLSKKINASRHVINHFVSQDTVTDRCEILTEDKALVSKYNEIIEANGPLFSTHAFDIGTCKNPQTGQIYKFSYRLKGEVTPYISKFIPVNDLKRPAATEIVNKLTEHGIIKRKSSPWASASVWVSKAKRALTKAEAEAQGKEYIPMETNQSAGVSLRLCVNYMVLNSYLIYPACALPAVKSLFSQLKESTVLYCMDLTWAYYGCVLSEESSLLTGFWTGIQSDSTMVFQRAAMGVRSSGSLLSAALANTLAPIRNNCITYSDNLVLHATESSGPALLDTCFKLLIKGGYKIKKSKTLIHVQQPIRILGITYDILNKRMHLDHEKTAALSGMDPPNNLKMLKSYLGGGPVLSIRNGWLWGTPCNII